MEQQAKRHQQSANIPTIAQPKDKVSIIGDIHTSEDTLSILSKGPKFILSKHIPMDKLQHICQVELAALAYNMRWQTFMEGPAAKTTPAVQQNTVNPSNLQKVCPFRNRRTEPPRVNKVAEKSIQGFQTDLELLISKQIKHSTPHNYTRKEKRALEDLRLQDDLLVTRSDKGGEMVIMHASLMENLCLEHLSDTTTYEKLKKDPTAEASYEGKQVTQVHT